MNRVMGRSSNDAAVLELREPTVAYMTGKPPVEPWMAGVGRDAADVAEPDCELTEAELDNVRIPGMTIRSWDDLRLKLDEGLAAVAAGRVTPHEQVFENLERKILTGWWDD